MNNFLLFIGGVLVVVLAALFAVPHFIDWNVYRSSFEAQAGKLLGREVRVGGQVSMRLLPAPYVSFENVRVADQEGRFSEPPLRVDAFTLWLSIPPLLRGTVEASEVDLRHPEFLVRLKDPVPGQAAGGDGPLSVVPVSIVLRSVNIHDGKIRVVNSAGDETIAFDKINGEFAAPSLEGPFRFRGSLETGKHEREIRLVTGKLEPGGAIAIDASVRAPEQANTYQVVGKLADFASSPVFTGELTVKPSADRKKPAQRTATDQADDLLPTFEIKSRLRLTMQQAELDDLNLAFEQSGTPQTLTGSAKAVFAGKGFSEKTGLTAALKARWLDLDRIGGADGKAGPQPALVRLAALARTWRPAALDVAARIAVEQATLGADTLQNLDIAFDQKRDRIDLSNISADIPGGGRISLSGSVSGAGDQGGDTATFQGPLRLRGLSFNRFVTWVLPGHAIRMEDGTGAFSIAGDLTLSKDRVALTRLRGEVVATSFMGDVGVDLRQRADWTVALESDRLDLRPFASGGGLKLADVSRILVGDVQPAADAKAPADGKTTAAATPKADTIFDLYHRANSDVRLKVGRLLLPDIELKDLSADIRRSDQATDVRTLTLSTLDGLKIEADGRVHTSDGRPRGAIKGHVELENPAALTTLLRFVDLPEAQALEKRASELMPMRLAGIFSMGARGGTGFELIVDGLAQETRTSLVARGDQEPGAWRNATLDLTGTLENRNASRLMAQLLPGTPPFSVGASDNGRLSARAIGIARSGISTSIELETKAVETGFSGVVTLPGDQASLSGEIGLKAADVADGLKLVGLRSARALQGRDLVLHSRLAAKGDEIDVAEAAMRLGSANIEARGRIKRNRGRFDVDLKAKSNEASLPAMLAIGLGTGMGAGAATAGGSGGEGVWSDDAIDLTALMDVGGKVRLETGLLTLGSGLSIEQAVVDADVSDSAIDLKSISGALLGGRATGNIRIEKAASGVVLQGAARLDGVKLDQITAVSGSGAPMTGAATGTVTFNGRGLTPRGVVATLAGKGNLQLADVRLTRYGPEGLDAAVAQALPPVTDDIEPTEIKNDAAVFKPVISAELDKHPLAIGSRSIPLEIADGAVRTKSLTFDVPRGRIRSTTFVDLGSIRLDSEATIETQARFEAQARVAKPGATRDQTPLAAAPVPGVTITLVGPLAELPRLEPRINSDAMARELLVRRLERDLEAIERARKKKEDAEIARRKAREEAERRDEEERKAAAEAAKPVPAVMPAGVTTVPAPVPVSPPPNTAQGSAPQGAAPDKDLPAPASAAPPSPASSQSPAAITTGAAPSAVPGEAAASTPPPPTAPRPAGPKGAQTGNRPPAIFDQSKGL